MKNDRFYSRIQTIPFHTCWEWVGDKNEKGYGRFNNKKAHRISYEIHNGEIPIGFSVMHICDNPSCVNPEHLAVGTHTDNMRDKVQKGRDWNKKKTHCKWGHEFSGHNLIIKKDGERRCRECRNKQLRDARNRAATRTAD